MSPAGVNYEKLISDVLSLGATAAVIISTKIICVEDRFRTMCAQPPCPGYGKSIHCPPHGMTPDNFRRLLENYKKALLFKIDVPGSILESEGSTAPSAGLQKVAADAEAMLLKTGFYKARAFAGGSCKLIFCKDKECPPLKGTGPCRYPELARPSMSGIGVNVFKLMADVGWKNPCSGNESNKNDFLTMVGLVLIE